MTNSNTDQRSIAFSPPDITEQEIAAVADALRSGWITTGPRTKQLERELCDFTRAKGFACFNSATASLECCLRALGIGPGDEVITSAYTYTASASPIVHLGATPVLCDTIEGGFEMDIDQLEGLITPATKAIIPVDLGGIMADYEALFAVLDRKADLWNPSTPLQKCFDRVIVVADGAHSLGATRNGKPSGSVADFTSFSFHAVKNFTTGEGGGLAWRENGFDSDAFYHELMLLSLHGQSKDALAKNQLGAWEYDIAFPGWKCNMTDIMAAVGLVQLQRYPDLLARRRKLIERYGRNLADAPVSLIDHYGDSFASSGHLMITRVDGISADQRNEIIIAMAQQGIATNVHYKPLPLMTAYQDLGFDPQDFPHAIAQYQNEITLPLHTLLTDDDVDYICAAYRRAIDGLK